MLIKLITEALENQEEELRNYIGASSIGNSCERAIWYNLHNYSKNINSRQKLTFKTGKYLETMIKDLLVMSGINITDNLRCQSTDYLFMQGFPDGFIILNGRRYIIEIKTAKDSSFNIFKKKGLRLWYPEYYDQVQSYMGMSGVHKCWLIALNKDTSDLHEELVLFDENRYKWLVDKAKRIGESEIEPIRISESTSYFKCKMCGFKRICHDLL